MTNTSNRWLASMAAAFVLTALVGCGAQPGKSTLSWNKGSDPPPLAKAPKDATYALYERKSTTPLWSGELEKGDRYGFRKNDAGTVVGYVEDTGEISLPTGFTTQGYFWSMQED